VVEDLLPDLIDGLAREWAESGQEDAGFVERGDHRQVVELAQGEVLRPASGGRVLDPRPLFLADLVPHHDAMRRGRPTVPRGGQMVEGTLVAPSIELTPAQGAQDFVRAAEHPQRAAAEVVRTIALPHL